MAPQTRNNPQLQHSRNAKGSRKIVILNEAPH
jgi:hypothetical protein